MKRNCQFGFTLVEVLTVIAIIALLAALILGLAGNAQKKAARTKAEAEVTQLGSFVTDTYIISTISSVVTSPTEFGSL